MGSLWARGGGGHRLTGHSVDGFEGPQDAHSADGRQVDVLKVQRVLHHPVERGEGEDGAGGPGTHTHPRVPSPAWGGGVGKEGQNPGCAQSTVWPRAVSSPERGWGLVTPPCQAALRIRSCCWRQRDGGAETRVPTVGQQWAGGSRPTSGAASGTGRVSPIPQRETEQPRSQRAGTGPDGSWTSRSSSLSTETFFTPKIPCRCPDIRTEPGQRRGQ